MMLWGTSPGATWRGVLAVSLFALPLLPALANAQTKEIQAELEARQAALRAQADKKADEAKEAAKAQLELEKARAELAQLQALLKSKQDQIRAQETKLAAQKGGQSEQPRLVVRLVDNDKKEATEIVLRKVGDQWEVVQPKKPGAAEFHLQFDNDSFRIVPTEPSKAQGKPPQPGKVPLEAKPGTPTPKPGPTAPEGRLEDLELQLQRIMKELESLRKEMKQPGKTGAAPSKEAPGIQLRLEGYYDKVEPIAPKEFELRLNHLDLTPEKPAPKPESK